VATRSIAAVSLLVVAAGLGAQEPASSPASLADLAGIWNLDRQASDDLLAELQPLLETLREAPGAAARGGHGDPADRLGSAGDGGPGPVNRRGLPMPERRDGAAAGAAAADRDLLARDGARDLALAVSQLLITIDGANLEIMDGTDRTQVWTPGGEPRVEPHPAGGIVRERAWWDGDTLVLESAGGPLQVTRRLRRSPDDHQLIVDVAVSAPGIVGQVRATLVYRDVR